MVSSTRSEETENNVLARGLPKVGLISKGVEMNRHAGDLKGFGPSVLPTSKMKRTVQAVDDLQYLIERPLKPR